MKRPVKLGTASSKALTLFVGLGVVAHAGIPYLPLLGPPPLRVQAVRSPVVPVVKLDSAKAPVVVEAKVSPMSTNVAEAAIVAAPKPLIDKVPELKAPEDKSLNDTFSASVFTLPTPDLLGITPQILATYFRPVQLGTNSALTGLFPLSFVPPLPPPDNNSKSSHAEYIVK